MKTKYGFTTTSKRSKLMTKIKSEDTKPETFLRKSLWRRGYRYRKNVSELPGKPDIVFKKKQLAIFVDGEFWHGYNWEEKKNNIKRNRDYWIPKIEKNIERDKKNTAKLETDGWTVLRFWEKEVNNNIESCIKIIEQILNQK